MLGQASLFTTLQEGIHAQSHFARQGNHDAVVMISTGVASSVVGGELWIPLPGDGSSQIKVFLQEPLPAFGYGHGRVAHTRLLFARAKSAITGELPAIVEARDAAHAPLD